MSQKYPSGLAPPTQVIIIIISVSAYTSLEMRDTDKVEMDCFWYRNPQKHYKSNTKYKYNIS